VKRSTLLDVLERNGTCHPVDYECKDPEAAMAWCASQLGKPYDLSALFGFLIHRDWHHAGKWFCTEFGAVAFEMGGSPKFRPEVDDRITPWDWWTLPGQDVTLQSLIRRAINLPRKEF